MCSLTINSKYIFVLYSEYIFVGWVYITPQNISKPFISQLFRFLHLTFYVPSCFLRRFAHTGNQKSSKYSTRFCFFKSEPKWTFKQWKMKVVKLTIFFLSQMQGVHLTTRKTAKQNWKPTVVLLNGAFVKGSRGSAGCGIQRRWPIASSTHPELRGQTAAIDIQRILESSLSPEVYPTGREPHPPFVLLKLVSRVPGLCSPRVFFPSQNPILLVLSQVALSCFYPLCMYVSFDLAVLTAW